MKKFKNISLTIVFLLLVTYFILFTSFHHLDRGNFFDSLTREPLLKSPITRTVFLLHEWGDARFEYLSPKKDTIFVEIDYQLDKEPGIDVEKITTEMIKDLLGKNTEVKYTQDKNIPDIADFTDKHIKSILKATRNHKATNTSNYLHIIYLSKSRVEPNNSGWVVGEDEIIIFKDTIDDLSNDPEILARVEESTIKHEFGHLLGVDHIERDNCIMSISVEVHDGDKYQKENIPTDFCGETLVAIDDFRDMI